MKKQNLPEWNREVLLCRKGSLPSGLSTAEKERDGGDTIKPFGLCFAALKPSGEWIVDSG
jgi:hypothetical protein